MSSDSDSIELINAITSSTSTSRTRKKSGVWDHFTRKVSDIGICKICNYNIKASGGSTSGMRSHLMRVHKMTFGEQNQPSTQKKKAKLDPKQPSIEVRVTITVGLLEL